MHIVSTKIVRPLQNSPSNFWQLDIFFVPLLHETSNHVPIEFWRLAASKAQGEIRVLQPNKYRDRLVFSQGLDRAVLRQGHAPDRPSLLRLRGTVPTASQFVWETDGMTVSKGLEDNGKRNTNHKDLI